eukprot:TRINITY_DN9720_c0_g1_i1.p1 TRINITY_DN9720_c0_g1~~TRINITY_DN9720_c0_g1_i1.p1  ORF type:complete len:835 (+),score=143.95 TRINITY_DN9720_c0_g1_i1:159-2507(+)
MGVLHAITNGVFATGADTDEFGTTAKDLDPQVSQYLLTSWQKRVDNIVFATVQSVYDGTFLSGSHLYNVANHGLEMSDCHESCPLWPVDLPILLETVTVQLATRALTTGITGISFTNHFGGSGTFVRLRPFNSAPPKVTGHAAVMTNANDMYIYGGTKSISEGYAEMYYYDHAYEAWSQLESSGGPGGLENHVMASYNDDIYIHGGVSGGIYTVGSLWKYVVSTQTWSLVSNSGPALHFHAAHVYDDKLYLFGGLQESAVKNDVWEYSFSTGDWVKVSTTGPSPIDLVEFCSTGFNNTMYVFGGKFIQDSRISLSSIIYVFNIDSAEWESYSSPEEEEDWPPGISGCSLSAVDERAVLYGGFTDEFVSDVWIFDNRFKIFEKQVVTGTVSGRLGHTAVTYEHEGTHRILIFGGSEAGTLSNQLFLYTIPPLTPIPETLWIDCRAKEIVTDKLGVRYLDRENEIYPYSYMCDEYVDCSNSWDEGLDCSPSLAGLWIGIGVIIFFSILFIFVSFVLVIVYWNHAVIVRSTRVFLIFILVGGLPGLLLFVPLVEFRTEERCGIMWWLIGLSFTLIFGSLAIKNFRIWRLFNAVNKLKKPNIITDTHMSMALAAVLLVDLVILAIWTGVDSVTPFSVEMVEDFEDKEKSHQVCKDLVDNPLLWIFVGYKFFIVGISAIIAFKTRVADEQYHEASYVALCVYGYLILAAIILPLYLLGLAPFATQVLSYIVLLFCVMIPELFIFVPKFLMIFWPENFEVSTAQTSSLSPHPSLKVSKDSSSVGKSKT